MVVEEGRNVVEVDKEPLLFPLERKMNNQNASDEEKVKRVKN